MAVLELRGLTKRYGSFVAVDHLDLTVVDGEMVALLGESGCGKTTTLRMVAGFTHPDEGEVRVDGAKMNGIPPYRRNIGIFFQNYALFPHLSCYDNVAFGLKLNKALDKTAIAKRVGAMLELVKLTGLEKRFPRELSGGQQQRVALARALVTEPKVLLLDEPLSNLDAKLRSGMQVEIKRIQRRLGLTTIVVTHDQEEAVAFADRLVIMDKGRIRQEGAPKTLYDAPKDEFVADFMGYTNFITGTVGQTENGRTTVITGDRTLVLRADSCPFTEGSAVRLAIREDKFIVFGE